MSSCNVHILTQYSDILSFGKQRRHRNSVSTPMGHPRSPILVRRPRHLESRNCRVGKDVLHVAVYVFVRTINKPIDKKKL